ncbi:MAG: VOC family protein, partial [Actinomycetes bacterium]
MSAPVEIDHVLAGVPDLDDAAATLQARFGLTALPGGRHPGWGTANRIVPLGSAYLELVTVVDGAEAAGSAFGRWVLAMLRDGPVCGWAVRTEDLDGVAARLTLDVVSGSRLTSTGRWLRWRTAGVDRVSAEPALPFFIEWGAGTVLP